MKKAITIISFLAVSLSVSGCPEAVQSSDSVQKQQQERILKEGTAQVGMPAIKNFRERKLMKDIIEMRDQDGLVTTTYTQSLDGKLVFLCNSIGYGLPAATQFTNPEKIDDHQYGYAMFALQ